MQGPQATPRFREPPARRPVNPGPHPAIPEDLVILYEESGFLVVHKPSGLPMHPNLDLGRPNLVDQVKAWLVRHGREDYVAVHQRLDLETSGVVLLGLERSLNKPLADLFEGRRVVKTYRALTQRPRRLPPVEWLVANRLEVAGKKRQSRTVSVAQGGQEAVTEFRLLQRSQGWLLVEARPRTGRKHQIRCHLAEGGLPILGDRRYGGPPAYRVMLHAFALELPHPVEGRPLRFEAPYPEDFQALLSRG